MAKILSCPNCGNNKNLNTNEKITTCSKCGYSWVNVSNSNIKSSEIKVVMDSINHYKYTLNNYNDEENTFPFYAIDNTFIESKNSNKNRLLKVHHVDEDFIQQGYVGINKFKPNSKRPRISYDDNVDMSVYKNPSERVVSDRSNQEYEVYRAPHQDRIHGNIEREHNASRSHNSPHREHNSLNEYAEKNPEGFFRDFEVVKVHNDGSIDVKPRQRNTDNNERNTYNQRDVADIREHRDFERNNTFEPQLREPQPRGIPNPFKSQSTEDRVYNENQDFIEPVNPYEGVDFVNSENHFDTQEPRHREPRQPKERVARVRNREEADVFEAETPESSQLTYAEYQEQRAKKLSEAKEHQAQRRERLKTKEYAARRSDKKYQKSADKKYTRKKEQAVNIPSQEEEFFVAAGEKNYRDKYINENTVNKEKISRESLEQNIISKKFKEETSNKKERASAEEEYEYLYNKKATEPANKPSPLSQPKPYSNIDEVINSQNFDENLLHSKNVPQGMFGKNPRLSFFENLKINSDGTIKEDPLGLNQNYNEFFKNNEDTQEKKKFTFKQIIDELKKHINKDKMSFNIVVIIIIFGFIGFISQMYSHRADTAKDDKELKMEQDFVNQIPTIDGNPKFNAATGTSDNLVINKGINGAVNDGTSITATEEHDSQEILSESKKNVSSNLSLEELKKDKLLKDESGEKTASPSASTFDKTLRYMGSKLEQFFGDVSSRVVSSKWTTVGNNKYFEVSVDLSNKVANKSYKVKTLEITILDISGNVIATREIHPDVIVRVKETINSTIRIPKAPPLAAKAYVKIKDASVL
ncbi:MAG: hypothetical protein LBQ34_06185 [Alphaproteobacteria bacterium]|jgi:hypothetical protein|nr:hypothetical protein [Alphaproteobacteria bacterium]